VLWPRRNDAIHDDDDDDDDDDAKNANGSSLLLLIILHLQFASFDDSGHEWH
jgi:hypothetical protein